MATDIKISELNEITVNNDLNQIIVNNRENSGDSGITKKIQISNLLTPNIVKTSNITDCNVTTNKIDNNAITCDKIADNTITSNQITCCGISNGSFATNSVDNRAINNSDNFTFNCVTAATNVNTPLATVTDKLTVGALGCGKTVSLNGINYDFPATETPNYFLQTDGDGNLDWAEAVPGDGTALVFSDIVPVGTIIPWAGAALPADGKWLECNGTTFDGTDFPELSAVLGNTWGTHSGVNYYLPNLQGRAAVGDGTGNDGIESCAFTLGNTGGKYNHCLSRQEINHIHFTGAFTQGGNDDYYPFLIAKPGGTTINTGATNIANTSYCGRWIAGEGNRTEPRTINTCSNNSRTATQPLNDDAHMDNVSHNNIQPYAVTRYIIKAKPDDIQQFGMNVGPGLSALNASGGQTASIDLSSSEIGLKVSDDFQFDGSGRLKLSLSPIIVGRKRVDYSGQKSTTKNGNWGSDNLPVSTELDLLMETNFTATSTSNKLHVKFEGLISNSNSGRGVKLALFNGTTCVGATPYLQPYSGNALTNVSFEFTPAPGNQTYQLRWGVSGDTGWVNRWGAYSPDYGGLVKSYLTIEEVSGTTYEVYTDPA